MIHPDARVVGAESDDEGLAGVDVQRVHPPWAARGRLAVAAEHEHVVAVEVHRVDVLRVVRDGHLDEVVLRDDEHRDVGVDPAVDRPLPAGPAVEEAEPCA